jgi:glycosyltransferase involved in cell wall biosynthesis
MIDMERIAVFLPSLDGGGAQRVMLTLVNGMSERGLAVDLVLARAEGPFLNQLREEVRLIDLRAGHAARSLPALTRYLRRERPRALLSSLNYVNIIALVARALARVNTRVVVSEHNTLTQARPKGFRTRLVVRLMPLMYPWADLVVAVSKGVAEDLALAIRLERGRIRVIYNPVVRPEILEKAVEPVDHPWFRRDQPPVVLAIGRLTEQKDFGNLIRAVALLREARNVRLMILGEGERRGELEAQVAELGITAHVALPGFVANPYAYMHQSSVFVLSSRWEGLPTVLIEALACGMRVVATDCPSGPAEILENGKWGRLVPVNDSAALAKQIDESLDDPAPPSVTERAQAFGIASAVDEYLCALRG